MAVFKSEAAKSGMTFLGTAEPGAVLCRSGRVKGRFAAHDVLELVPIPRGAMVLDVRLMNEALDACTTVTVGDRADPARYGAGLDLSAEGVRSLLCEGAVGAFSHVYADHDVLTVTVPAAQTTARAVCAHVFYKMAEGSLTDEAQSFPAS